MEIEASQVCECGRSFSQLNAVTKHKRSCKISKRHLSTALDKAKKLWKARKRRRLDPDNEESILNQPSSAGLVHIPSPETHDTVEVRFNILVNQLGLIIEFDYQAMVGDLADTADDSNLSMMERRPWGQRLNRQPPMRFRDILPQPPAPLPPAHIAQSIIPSSNEHPLGYSAAVQDPDSTRVSLTERIGQHICRIFTTPKNIFGLSRRYYAKGMPTYDPEEHISMLDLSNIPTHTPSYSASQPFYPYPNNSAFSLGDWFWNGGVNKSQASFDKLMQIIGDPGFRVEDVRGVKWNQINKELATEDENEWLDEDAGWIRTPVTISVPYQPRRGIPSVPDSGPRDYAVGDFHHKSLVSVIREKISGLNDSRPFHFEPYELLWQPARDQEPIRVQGELYTSPAFIDAHRELQDSPGEPGCEIPRFILPLMFWSDSTQLTAFGNAKLWPLYLFFGGDSKYQRCKPSSHLCEHVAYFQSVSLSTSALNTLSVL